ncbi:hypothetical protein RUM43_002019, partial [Polyplax serrata]
ILLNNIIINKYSYVVESIANVIEERIGYRDENRLDHLGSNVQGCNCRVLRVQMVYGRYTDAALNSTQPLVCRQLS